MTMGDIAIGSRIAINYRDIVKYIREKAPWASKRQATVILSPRMRRPRRTLAATISAG
jgi:hypothetical protein